MKFSEKDLKKIKEDISFLKKGFAVYKTLEFCENDLIEDDFSRVFEVTVYGETHCFFEVEFDTTNFRGDLVVFVNDAKKCVYKPVNGHNRFGFDCEMKSGRNVIELVCEHYYDVTDVLVRVTGFLLEKDYGSRLCVLTMDDGYIVTAHNGAKIEHTIDRYLGGERTRIISTRDKFTACSKLDGTSFVYTFGNGVEMCAELLSSEGDYLGKSTLYSADSDYFCAVSDPHGAAFYSVEKGKIKKYLFNGDLDLTVTDTGFTGKEVVDCGEGFIGVVGFDGSVRLICDE